MIITIPQFALNLWMFPFLFWIVICFWMWQDLKDIKASIHMLAVAWGSMACARWLP